MARKRIVTTLTMSPSTSDLAEQIRLNRGRIYDFGAEFLATLAPETREFLIQIGPKEAAALFEQYRNEVSSNGR